MYDSRREKRENLIVAKNILILSSSINSGVIDQSVIDVSAAAQAQGFGITVVSAGGKLVKELKKQSVEHILLPINSSDWFVRRANSKKIADIVKARNIGLIHAFTPQTAAVAARVSKIYNIRYITSYMKFYKQDLLSKIFKRKNPMTGGSFTIVPSEFMASYLQAAFHVPADKIVIIPGWVDTDIYNSNAVSPERMISVASSLRIPEDKFIITTVSSLNRTKGWQGFLNAIAMLPDNKKLKLQVLVVGEHTKLFKTEFLRYASRLGIDNIFHLVGEVADLPALLMLSDVYVSINPAPKASAPHLLKAESLGRPSVLANVGSAPEYVVDKSGVALYDPQDPATMVSALLWAMDLTKDARAEISRKLSSGSRMKFAKSTLPLKFGDVYNFVFGAVKS